MEKPRTEPLLRPPRSLPPASLRITIVGGPDSGQSVTVDRPRVLIGRGETADVRVTDRTVSQCHAELFAHDKGVLVCDLDSLNGVRVGPVLVERCVVPPDTEVTLGATVIRIERDVVPRPPAPRGRAFGPIVGAAPAMRELYAMLERLAQADISLVIQGETGTGKELCARAVHAAGRRAGGPFVVLDCTAIPPSLAPSVLFGSEKGAYTGATERRAGVFEAAHGGTLFMDEIGELPAELQPMLLRVLQQREVTPVGGTRARPVDVRVISATWRDLRAMVNQGTFREDLYYRLAQATVHVPALHQRPEDVPLLIRHVLSRIPSASRAARDLTDDALAALASRPYPGNVRELASTVERLALLADGPTITMGDLAFERMLHAERRHAPALPPGEAGGVPDGSLGPFKEAKKTHIDEFERDYLKRLLERAASNLTRAAAVAGLERNNLRALLKKHGLYGTRDEGGQKA